jgi:two-component system CheB/CheR fusion protein
LTLTKETNLAELTRRALLQDFGPASVVTDLAGNILYVHGDTGSYLRPAPGHASLNVIDMAREGLQLEMRSAVRRAAQSGESTSGHSVTVTGDGIVRPVNLSVRRMAGTSQSEQLLLITFQETSDSASAENDGTSQNVVAQSPPDRVNSLERDLAYTRENFKPRLTNCSTPTRNWVLRMKRCSRPTRSCNPRTKNWKRPGKSCNRSMRS